MKKNANRQSNQTRILLMTILLLMVSLSIIGCGEVAMVGDIDTGGGGSYSLMLSWTAPTTNEDGSFLEDLAGYKLYYGTQPGQYTQIVTVGDYTTVEIDDLGSGTYYVTVTAYDIYGNESDFSNEIYHTF